MAYTNPDMVRISKKEAIERFQNNLEVYGLDEYSDTEGLIETAEDFRRFEQFGYEKIREGLNEAGKRYYKITRRK